MNSPSVSISWKRAIEIVLLNRTMEFFNNSIGNFYLNSNFIILLMLYIGILDILHSNLLL